MTTVIKICDRFGTDVSNRHNARELRFELIRSAASGRVRVDFSGVESISDSFLDELIAVLIDQRGPTWFRGHVELHQLREEDRASLLHIVTLRRRQAQDRADDTPTSNPSHP